MPHPRGKAAGRAATRITAIVRGGTARADLREARSAAVAIQARARGQAVRTMCAQRARHALVIQRVERGRIARKVVNAREGALHARAYHLIAELLAVQEGPSSAPRIAHHYLCNDFVDEVEMSNFKGAVRGVREYLQTAMVRKPPMVKEVRVPLWVVRSSIGKTGKVETTLEREVRYAQHDGDVRVEYKVRHGAQPSLDRICWRRTAQRQPALAGPDLEDVQSPRPASSHLFESFSKLDVDGSGHLSIAEIVSASNLVGLSFDRNELTRQLLMADHDRDGTFELHELRAILKKDRALERSGIENHERPIIFDVLPLVARSFDAHQAVDNCIKAAVAREEKNARSMRRAREAAARRALQKPGMLAVKQAAKGAKWRFAAQAASARQAANFESSSRRDGRRLKAVARKAGGGAHSLDGDESSEQRIIDASTTELATLLERCEHLTANSTLVEDECLGEMQAALDLACAEWAVQRERVSPERLRQRAAQQRRQRQQRNQQSQRTPPSRRFDDDMGDGARHRSSQLLPSLAAAGSTRIVDQLHKQLGAEATLGPGEVTIPRSKSMPAVARASRSPSHRALPSNAVLSGPAYGRGLPPISSATGLHAALPAQASNALGGASSLPRVPSHAPLSQRLASYQPTGRPG